MNALLFFLLFNLASIGQVVSDLYLPALPAISQALHTSTHTIQLTLSFYFAGFALSHFFYGPTSDHFGRKPPLIIGLTLCCISCLACALSQTAPYFLACRLLQGLGAGAAAALYRSILRDLYSGQSLAVLSSYIGVGRVFLLALAPLIGAYIHMHCGWPTLFIVLAVYACICLVLTTTILTETRPRQSSPFLYRKVLKHTGQLIQHRAFMGYTLTVMLAFSCIVAWLATIPLLLQQQLGLSAIQFGWVAAVSGGFFIVGGVINALLLPRYGIQYLLYAGIGLCILAGLLMLCLSLCVPMSTAVITLPIIVFIIGSSAIFPNAYTGAFEPFPHIAGTASAIFGAIQMLGGVVGSAIMSFTNSHYQTPLAITLICLSVIMLILIKTMTSSHNA